MRVHILSLISFLLVASSLAQPPIETLIFVPHERLHSVVQDHSKVSQYLANRNAGDLMGITELIYELAHNENGKCPDASSSIGVISTMWIRMGTCNSSQFYDCDPHRKPAPCVDVTTRAPAEGFSVGCQSKDQGTVYSFLERGHCAAPFDIEKGETCSWYAVRHVKAAEMSCLCARGLSFKTKTDPGELRKLLLANRGIIERALASEDTHRGGCLNMGHGALPGGLYFGIGIASGLFLCMIGAGVATLIVIFYRRRRQDSEYSAAFGSHRESGAFWPLRDTSCGMEMEPDDRLACFSQPLNSGPEARPEAQPEGTEVDGAHERKRKTHEDNPEKEESRSRETFTALSNWFARTQRASPGSSPAPSPTTPGATPATFPLPPPPPSTHAAPPPSSAEAEGEDKLVRHPSFASAQTREEMEKHRAPDDDGDDDGDEEPQREQAKARSNT